MELWMAVTWEGASSRWAIDGTADEGNLQWLGDTEQCGSDQSAPVSRGVCTDSDTYGDPERGKRNVLLRSLCPDLCGYDMLMTWS